MSISVAQYFLYLQYMLIGLGLTMLFMCVYLRITPVAEMALIKQGNVACALSAGGAMLGFCLAVASSIAHSLGLVDFMLWALAAAVIQIVVYAVATRLIPDVSQHLANNNVAVGAFLAILSISIGVLNAACLT